MERIRQHAEDFISKRNGEELVQIFVDADACPVVGIIETITEKYNIPTTLLCDTNHIKGPKKRTEEDDVRFAQSFEKMLMMVQEAVF